MSAAMRVEATRLQVCGSSFSANRDTSPSATGMGFIFSLAMWYSLSDVSRHATVREASTLEHICSQVAKFKRLCPMWWERIRAIVWEGW